MYTKPFNKKNHVFLKGINLGISNEYGNELPTTV